MAVYIITSKAYFDGRYKVGHTTKSSSELLAQYKRTLSEPTIKLFVSTPHYKQVERSILDELATLRVLHDSGSYSEYVIWDYNKLSRLVLRTVEDFETDKHVNKTLNLSLSDLKLMCNYFDIPMNDNQGTPEYYTNLLRNYKSKKAPLPETSSRFDFSGMSDTFSRYFSQPVREKSPPKPAPRAPEPAPKVLGDKNINLTDPQSTKEYLIRVYHELKKINPSFKLYYSSSRCTLGLDCGGKIFLAEHLELPNEYQEFTSSTDIYSTELELKNYIKRQLKKLLS